MSESLKYDEIELRVRYGETDQMGVVYHGNYAQYFEVGRVEWLRKLGISYKGLEASGIMLPVISLYVNYKRPARYDDLITVKTHLVKMPSVTIEFAYEIWNARKEQLATGKTTLVFMDIERNRPMRCPNNILDKLQN